MAFPIQLDNDINKRVGSKREEVKGKKGLKDMKRQDGGWGNVLRSIESDFFVEAIKRIELSS